MILSIGITAIDMALLIFSFGKTSRRTLLSITAMISSQSPFASCDTVGFWD